MRGTGKIHIRQPVYLIRYLCDSGGWGWGDRIWMCVPASDKYNCNRPGATECSARQWCGPKVVILEQMWGWDGYRGLGLLRRQRMLYLESPFVDGSFSLNMSNKKRLWGSASHQISTWRYQDQTIGGLILLPCLGVFILWVGLSPAFPSTGNCRCYLNFSRNLFPDIPHLL